MRLLLLLNEGGSKSKCLYTLQMQKRNQKNSNDNNKKRKPTTAPIGIELQLKEADTQNPLQQKNLGLVGLITILYTEASGSFLFDVAFNDSPSLGTFFWVDWHITVDQ